MQKYTLIVYFFQCLARTTSIHTNFPLHKDSPEVFQRVVNYTLSKYKGQSVWEFMDNRCIGSEYFEKHLLDLEKNSSSYWWQV